MTWARGLQPIEWAYIGLFVVVYAIYVARTVRLARILRTPSRYVATKLVLRTVYFGLLLVAFMGPSFGRIRQEVKALGKDVFIAVDISASMNAFDVAPSRLEKVRFELKNLLNLLDGDRLGLIVFSDEAFLQCPLTYDQTAIQLFIESLSTHIINGGGTDLSQPLRLAVERFTKSEAQESARAVVLISDGEDFADRYQSVTDELERAGVRVFTVGVGTVAGGPVPDGSRFKKDESGGQVVSKLNPAPLAEIARATGGRYYEVTQNTNGFPALGRDLQAMQGQVIEVKKLDVAANKYTYALAIALALALLDVLVPIRVLRLKK